jgi:hypothetical protein
LKINGNCKKKGANGGRNSLQKNINIDAISDPKHGQREGEGPRLKVSGDPRLILYMPPP